MIAMISDVLSEAAELSPLPLPDGDGATEAGLLPAEADASGVGATASVSFVYPIGP